MGQAIITSGGTDALYNVRLVKHAAKSATELATIAKRLIALTPLILAADNKIAEELAAISPLQSALDMAIILFDGTASTIKALTDAQTAVLSKQKDVIKARTALSLLVAEEDSITKRQKMLTDAMAAETLTGIWCTDLTENLVPGTTVGTMEMNGVDDQIIITPGGAVSKSIGLLQHTGVSTGAAVFCNRARLPAWQKWKPNYRVGAIVTIDYMLNVCDVGIEEQYSEEQGLKINQPGKLYTAIQSAVSGWDDFASKNPSFPLVTNTFDSTIPSTAQLLADLNTVNNYVNDRNTYILDDKQFGKLENWAIMADGGRGDCEDFALTKASKLLAMGYPASSLHIEIGMYKGVGHAWLVVQTDKGDLALDNRYQGIMNNYATPYYARQRQTGMVWSRKGVLLEDVPIEYMDGLNAGAFGVGDRVVVQFTGQDWDAPKVIGFEDHPKGLIEDGAWVGVGHHLILDKNGNLTDKIYYTTPARDIKMTHIRSAGLEGVMSWACTFDGKLYIWGGSFLDESGIGFTSSPLRYFSGSFPWNGSFVEPMEILANLGLKIRQAHIIAFDYGVTAPPEDYLNDVCLCFVTQSNDLYLYHKTEGIFYPKAWTGSAFEYAYYTPPLYYYKVASNVRTARMFMPGYNRTTSYVSIPAALPGKPISTGLGSFTQEMPSLVWIDKAGNFCGYGINCAGEMGPGSVDDSRITIPGLSAAPTWSAYLAIIGLNETISMSYAEWLAAGQPFPILSNDAYCWDAGGVTRYTDAGAAAWTYFQVIYLPQEKWREPTYKWPPYPIRKTGGIIIAGNFVSMTTIGYQRYIEDRAYVNGVEGGLGVNMMYSTLLLDSSGKLWGLGTHYPIGQLGDYRGYAGPWNRTLYDGYGTSSPWNMFAGIVFTKLHPTFQRFFNYESEEGTYGILFADALVDGKKVTYMWGVSSVSHKTWDWIVQHEIATPPLPGGTEIKYIACGDMRQWALSQDLLAVSVDGKYYVATYQHNDPEVMTAPIWQYAGQL